MLRTGIHINGKKIFWRLLSGFVCAAVFLLFSSQPSHAFRTYSVLPNGSLVQNNSSSSEHDTSEDYSSSKVPSPTVVDSCLPLLESIQYDSTSSTTRIQRPAGETTGFGLVFGLRLPLKPTGNGIAPARSEVRLGLWHSYERYGSPSMTVSVSAYKDCQLDQALNALRDFRWVR